MKYIKIIILLGISNITFSQFPIMDKVSNEICDSLSKIKIPIEDLSLDSYKKIQRYFILSNYDKWKAEIAKFEKDTNQKDWVYDNLYRHTLQLKCEEFRIIDLNYDNYLTKERDLKIRPQYLISREFTYLLEQDSSYQKLESFLNQNIQSEETKKLIEISKKEIDKFKWKTTLSNILTYENGFTFRIRYSDYTNRETEYKQTKFQIDINFKDETDLLIDKIEIKFEKQLKEELKSRIEYNKKIESGEIESPSPPRKKKKNKK